MPSQSVSDASLKALVEDFVHRVVSVVETAVTNRVRGAIASALGGGEVSIRRGPGRPRKNPLNVAAPVAKKARKKAPKQLCPVPGCKNPAAPVYGMVCAKHKGVAKTQIKKYREARKAAKSKK